MPPRSRKSRQAAQPQPQLPAVPPEKGDADTVHEQAVLRRRINHNTFCIQTGFYPTHDTANDHETWWYYVSQIPRTIWRLIVNTLSNAPHIIHLLILAAIWYFVVHYALQFFFHDILGVLMTAVFDIMNVIITGAAGLVTAMKSVGTFVSNTFGRHHHHYPKFHAYHYTPETIFGSWYEVLINPRHYCPAPTIWSPLEDIWAATSVGLCHFVRYFHEYWHWTGPLLLPGNPAVYDVDRLNCRTLSELACLVFDGYWILVLLAIFHIVFNIIGKSFAPYLHLLWRLFLAGLNLLWHGLRDIINNHKGQSTTAIAQGYFLSHINGGAEVAHLAGEGDK